MKTSNDLFQDSINHYKQLINVASHLYDNIKTLPHEELFKQCESLNNLQRQQQHIEKFIIEIMIESGPQVLACPNIDEYQCMLAKARHICDKIAMIVKATRSKLDHEIHSSIKASNRELKQPDGFEREPY